MPSASIWEVKGAVPTLDYLVTDSQFFTSGLRWQVRNLWYRTINRRRSYCVSRTDRRCHGEISSSSNTSFFVDTSEFEVRSGETVSRELRLFVGPKLDELLQSYGMKNVIEYGWFRTIARTLGGVMHFFQGIVGNFGVAIIMLTILVRGCMHPLSRKQVRSTQMMGFSNPKWRESTRSIKMILVKKQ